MSHRWEKKLDMAYYTLEIKPWVTSIYSMLLEVLSCNTQTYQMLLLSLFDGSD